MPTLPRVRSLVAFVSLVALCVGLVLVLYARWTAPLARASAAAAAADQEDALAAYHAAVERFGQWPVMRRLMVGDHALGAHNELALLYRLGRYDDLIDRAPAAPAEAAPHFWAGCALFKKGAYAEDAEKQLEWLTRAEDEFKLALAAAPDDWDAKFNYELTARLTAALRPSDKSGPQQKGVPASLMRLLRPESEEQRQKRPIKKVG